VGLVSLGLAWLLLVVAGGAGATTIGISGNMDGSIEIANGDYVAAGYSFSVPGAHPEGYYTLADASVTIHGPCSNGGSDLVVIQLPTPIEAYYVPAKSSKWFPTGDLDSTASYQGSTLVSGICGGTGTLEPGAGGASFSADVHSTDTADPVHVRFHYRDPNAKGKGNVDCSLSSPSSAVCGAGWSATRSVTPDLAAPSLTTHAVTPVTLDASGRADAFDVATLTGAVHPTGTVTFHLFKDDGSGCDSEIGGQGVNGTVMGPTVRSPGITITQLGVYHWRASYSGDANNRAVPLTRCGLDDFVVDGGHPMG
jgi:hypothetical protein